MKYKSLFVLFAIISIDISLKIYSNPCTDMLQIGGLTSDYNTTDLEFEI